MKMSYVSDSVFYTDGNDYYCDVYFSPDEISSLCEGVDHLYVTCRIREMDKNHVYKKISWSNGSVEFINIEDPKGNKIKQLKNIFDVSKKLNEICDISYLKFCFVCSYMYGLLIPKNHKNKIYFSHMVGDPDCILYFAKSTTRKVFMMVLNCIQKKLYSIIARKMDLQIFVSNKLKEKYAEPSVKTIIVNENRFRESEIVVDHVKSTCDTNCLKLLFVGRLSPEKRVNDLITVLKNQQEVCLSIVGDGFQKDELIELAQTLGVTDRVIFLGRKKWGDELFSEMKKHDVLMLPSENEGLPLVIAEAMSCGLTVIASNVGGIPEIVKNDVNGILFEKADLNMLEKAINRMKDHEFRSKLVDEALKTAHEFSFERQTEILKGELKKILRKD